jgi:excisionase family DNA binding protein
MRCMNADDYISTNDAAHELGITRQRVLQLIKHERLKAERFANVYMIRRSDLAAVADRPTGRPPKQATATSKKKGKK